MATFRAHGEPNLQRFAEVFMELLAAKEGRTVVPGSVRVERRTDELPEVHAEGPVHRFQTDAQRQPLAEVPMP
jgi:hypothetical protein